MRTRLVALAGLLAFLPAAARAATIEVAPGPGTPLQDAIAAAAPGDTLQLLEGTFSEAVTVGKRVRIRGSVSKTKAILTTVDALCGAPYVFDVTASGARLESLVVQGGTEGGVRVKDVEHVKLKHVVAQAFQSVPGQHCGTEQYGIAVEHSRKVLVDDCHAVGTYWAVDQTYYVFGVAGIRLAALEAQSTVKVSRSSSMGNPVDILVESSEGLGIKVAKNATDSRDTGILLQGAQRVVVKRNAVFDNDASNPQAGIRLDATSHENRIIGNIISGAVADVLDEGSGNCWKKNEFTTGTLPPDNCS